MMAKTLIIGILSLSLQSLHGQMIKDDTCRRNDIVLYHGNDIPKKFDDMMRRYNATCTSDTCSLQPHDNLVGLLKFNYGNPNFALRRLCENNRNRGYKLCELQTVAVHTFPRAGVDIDGYIVEDRKPVCFPPTCSDDQANILDPNPGNCDPETMNCRIVHYSVNCPNRQVSNTQQCDDNKLSSTSAFFVTRGVNEAAILADCASLLTGVGSIGLCTASTGPVDSTTFSNFTGFETDPFYVQHENECNSYGGRVCHFDMVANFTVPAEKLTEIMDELIPLESASDVVLRHTFTNFPRCIAQGCDESMEDVLVYHANIFLNKFGLRCDINSDLCNIDIENVRCNDPPIETSLLRSSSP